MLYKKNLHSYQNRSIEHIIETPKCALWLDLGMGKTVSTLTALEDLMYDSFTIPAKVIIIAPLRVANTVWKQEAAKWEHLKGLSFSNLSGGKANMIKGLQRSADIYLINRENVKGLVEYLGDRWDFETLIIDESSSFKSHSSQRFKALKKVLPKIDRVIELTGTPSPNGYMDLWSQFFLLDGGYRLGRTITFFRNRYFDKDFMGYTYTMRNGAVKSIQDGIQDLVISMSADDYLEMPDFVSSVIDAPLLGSLLKQYKRFEKDMILNMSKEDHITAMSAASLTNKLLQFCSGNMYDENRKVHHIHDLKIEILKELREDNPNDNMLIAYSYRHELDALVKAFPEAVVMDKKGVAIAAWNKGEIGMLIAHPSSAAHGLNLQDGGSLIIWMTLTWSLELYQQFNGRLHRQGQKNTVRCIHIAVGQIEHDLMVALSRKDITQAQLLSCLK